MTAPTDATTKTGRHRCRLASPRGESALQELLTELASTLLPRGMTPKRFSELARFAFVRAAAERSKLRNGRVNHSRVSAQTGLSRSDVKRLLLQSSVLTTESYAQAPMERVIAGWRTDRMFAHRPGRPRRLRISGTATSFANLVRRYGGDLPHRAVLEELRRLGAVSDGGDSVQLNPSQTLRRRHDLAFLSPVLPALLDGIRIASKRTGSRPSSSIYRLTLPIKNDLDLAIVRERSASSAKSMLDGLGASLGTSVTVPRRRRKMESSFTITILLAEKRAARA
jgi:hypothetical protein